jgi:hypothetical protein
MGAAGGGVWKTHNAGVTWDNISDGQIPVGTIGAIAVAPSDPNVIYVGTGEAPIRGVTTSQGEGLWKSTDAGRTFTFMGLRRPDRSPRSRSTPAIRTRPGSPYRGRSGRRTPSAACTARRDGGQTWEQVLKVNADTGATDLSLDPTNPRILYAALWHHGRKPWYIKSGGDGGGIYKSTRRRRHLEEARGRSADAGGQDRPRRLRQPAVACLRHHRGGVWPGRPLAQRRLRRELGAHQPHRVLHSRAWYYIHITADPVDPDTVWVLNVPLMKSIDGGETFSKISTPHGDHHDHWINPRQPHHDQRQRRRRHGDPRRRRDLVEHPQSADGAVLPSQHRPPDPLAPVWRDSRTTPPCPSPPGPGTVPSGATTTTRSAAARARTSPSTRTTPTSSMQRPSTAR